MSVKSTYLRKTRGIFLCVMCRARMQFACQTKQQQKNDKNVIFIIAASHMKSTYKGGIFSICIYLNATGRHTKIHQLNRKIILFSTRMMQLFIEAAIREVNAQIEISMHVEYTCAVICLICIC